MTLHWKELVIAVLLATTLWYSVTRSEKVDTQVPVRIEYKGIPQGMVVRSGLMREVLVRVQATAGLIRSVADKEHVFAFDLSALAKGKNTLPIEKEQLPFRNGIEVMEIKPSRLEIEVDSLETKLLPLQADMASELPADLTVQTDFTPEKVSVFGPSRVLESLRVIPVPVVVGSDLHVGSQTSKVRLALPEGLRADPAEVNLTLRVEQLRRTVELSRNVEVYPEGAQMRSVPKKVTLTLSVPASMAAKVTASSDVEAFVRVPTTKQEQYELPVQVSLPTGVELIGLEPGTVVITPYSSAPPALQRK